MDALLSACDTTLTTATRNLLLRQYYMYKKYCKCATAAPSLHGIYMYIIDAYEGGGGCYSTHSTSPPLHVNPPLHNHTHTHVGIKVTG